MTAERQSICAISSPAIEQWTGSHAPCPQQPSLPRLQYSPDNPGNPANPQKWWYKRGKRRARTVRRPPLTWPSAVRSSSTVMVPLPSASIDRNSCCRPACTRTAVAGQGWEESAVVCCDDPWALPHSSGTVSTGSQASLNTYPSRCRQCLHAGLVTPAGIPRSAARHSAAAAAVF